MVSCGNEEYEGDLPHLQSPQPSGPSAFDFLPPTSEAIEAAEQPRGSPTGPPSGPFDVLMIQAHTICCDSSCLDSIISTPKEMPARIPRQFRGWDSAFSLARAVVQSLIRERRSLKPWSNTKKRKEKCSFHQVQTFKPHRLCSSVSLFIKWTC